jgi:REP element-mobilizing transposase RayT
MGSSSWARGYCVSKVGLNETIIREYIRKQEATEKEQLELDLK